MGNAECGVKVKGKAGFDFLFSFRIPHSEFRIPTMLDFRLILVAVLWGVNFSAVKYALTDFFPLSFTLVRFFLASLFLFGVMGFRREAFGIERRDRWPVIALGFTGITLYNILFMYGLERTTASNSALFIATSPLFAAVLQSLGKGERLTLRNALGFLLSFFGALLIIRARTEAFTLSWQNLAGDVLTLCAAFSWALYTILAGPLLQRYSPVKVTAYAMGLGTVLLLPFGMGELARQSWSNVSILTWAALAFAAFAAGGVAYVLWYQGVKRIGAARTIVYHYLMPVAAVIFAALALHERITVLHLLGGAAVLSGVYLVQRNRKEQRA